MVPKLINGNFAFGAFPIERTRNQYLFRVVTNEIRQDGMASTPDPIPAHHWQTCFAMRRERSQEDFHAKME